jgi:hypothetical protein
MKNKLENLLENIDTIYGQDELLEEAPFYYYQIFEDEEPENNLK